MHKTTIERLNLEELRRKFKEKHNLYLKSQIKEKEHKPVSSTVQPPQFICMARS